MIINNMKRKKFALLLLLLAVGFNGCKKDNNDKEESSEYYFRGTIDGSNVSWNVTETSDWQIATSSSNSYDQTGRGLGAFSATIDLNSNHPEKPGAASQFAASFKTYEIIQVGVSADIFNNFITAGPWPNASTKNRFKGIKDMYLQYTTADDKRYSSIGSQTGSSFNVVSVTQLGETHSSNASLKIKMNFNCKLYPDDGIGNPLTLNNGEAILYLENFW